MNRKLKPKRPRAKPLRPQATATLVDDLWYTPRETAGFIRTSAGVLAIWRCRGLHPELRPTVIGRKVLYQGKFIRQFLESHTRAEKVA